MLKTCGNEACHPIEQIRGEMRPGDYYDVIVNNRVPVPGAVLNPERYGVPVWGEVPEGVDPALCVEMNESLASSFRICCKTCGKATAWSAKDFPEMPDAGADYVRKKWNMTTNLNEVL